jgi:hypothetical protein
MSNQRVGRVGGELGEFLKEVIDLPTPRWASRRGTHLRVSCTTLPLLSRHLKPEKKEGLITKLHSRQQYNQNIPFIVTQQ